MNYIEQSMTALRKAFELKVDGTNSSNDVFEVYQDILECYVHIGSLLSEKYNTKESAVLDRKMSYAKSFKSFEGMTIKAKEITALVNNFDKFDEEKDRESEYESYKTLRQSLDRAMSFLSQLQSAIRQIENSHS